MDNPYDDVVDSINAQYLEGATVSTETDLDDGTGASDTKLASQKAVKTYVDAQVFAAGNPIQTIGEITTNPTGVLSQDDFTVSWDNTSKIFTITPVATEKDIYVNGVKHTVPVTGETCRNGYEFTIAEGMWYFFYKINSTGNDLELAADQTLDINNNAIVAYGYYDSTTHTATAHDYLTSTNTGGNTAVMNHEIVKIDTGYAGGGSPGDYYLKVPSAAAPLGDETLDLDGINYLTTDKFTNITGYVADVVYPNFLGGDLYLELHQTKLGTEEHRLRHIYDGAQYKSGLELYNNVLAGNTQPTSNIESRIAVQAGAIADEDLDVAIVNDATPDAVFDQDLGGTSNATAQTNPALIPILYRRISAGTTYWSLTKPMPVPFYHTYGTTYPYYDNAGTLTAVTAGYSVPYFIIATNHKKYPIMAIAGQAQYSTADAAMVDPYSAIDFGTYSASAEIKVLWRVVIETKSTWSNANHKCKISRVTDYRSNAGNVINRLQVSNHSSLSSLDYASSGHTGFAKTPYIKAVAPTVDEDILSGYAIGDIWFDTTANKYYAAKSVGAGAASWTELTVDLTLYALKSFLLTPATHPVTAADYAILDDDGYERIEVDTTAGEWDITLPLIANNAGRRIEIALVKADASADKVIVKCHATDGSKLSSDALAEIWLTKVGDFITVQHSATSGYWEIVDKNITSFLRLNGYAGLGNGSNSKIPYFTNVAHNIGNMFTLTSNDNVTGCVITINKSGIYTLLWTGLMNAYHMGFTKNSAELTTNVYQTTVAEAFLTVGTWTNFGGETGLATWTGRLEKNDVIRPHGDGGGMTASVTNQIYVGFLE